MNASNTPTLTIPSVPLGTMGMMFLLKKVMYTTYRKLQLGLFLQSGNKSASYTHRSSNNSLYHSWCLLGFALMRPAWLSCWPGHLKIPLLISNQCISFSSPSGSCLFDFLNLVLSLVSLGLDQAWAYKYLRKEHAHPNNWTLFWGNSNFLLDFNIIEK